LLIKNPTEQISPPVDQSSHALLLWLATQALSVGIEERSGSQDRCSSWTFD
jgi:hypothetical protein